MIEWRSAEKEDFEFLYKLRKWLYKEIFYGNQIWDEDLQRNYFLHHFYPKRYLIITKSGQKIGCFSIFKTRKSIEARRMYILPEFRGQGIATYIFKKIISLSIEEKKPLFLLVHKTNKKAQKLYFRLDFTIINEIEGYYYMQCNILKNES